MVEKKKSIATLSIVLSSLVLISFCTYWFLRFYDYIPKEGTSTASISALWGQFIVSLIFVFAIIVALIFLDRRVDTKFYKLFSFWIIVALLAAATGYYIYNDISYGSSATHELDKPFRYNGMEYTLSKSKEPIVYVPQDCSKTSTSTRLFTNNYCEENNNNNKKSSEDNLLLIIKITAKNVSSSPQDTICKECITLRNVRGDVISQEWNLESQAFSKQIFSENQVEINAKYKVKKGEIDNVYYLTFSTNKAPQYIEIK